MMKKAPSPPPRSNRGQKRRTAIALGVGTCLVMGILAMEVIRRQDSDPSLNGQTKNKPLIVLKNPDDLKLHRDLNQLETRIQESKRLLFSRENALETKRVKALRERLDHAEAYAEQLERRNDELKIALNEQKEKVSEYDKTAIALVDTIELQKSSKESAQKRLMTEIEELKDSFEQEKKRLQSDLAQKEASETALKNSLQAKEQELQNIHGALEQKTADHNQAQEASMHANESKNTLIEEINLIKDRLQENEAAALDLERALKEAENNYSEQLKELHDQLQRSKNAYSDLNDSYAALQSRYMGLEALLEQQERQNEELLARLDNEGREKEILAMASEDYQVRAGSTLAKRDEELSLNQAYSDMAIWKLKQDVQKNEDERAALIANLDDLKREIDIKQQEIAVLQANMDNSHADVYSLQQELEQEKAKSAELQNTLDTRPPVRDTEREDALERELNAEKDNADKLRIELSSKEATHSHLEREIALLENSLLESRTYVNNLSGSETGLKAQINDLEDSLAREKRAQEALEEEIAENEKSKQALTQEIRSLNAQLDQARADRQDNEFKLLQESLKQNEAMTALRQEHETLSGLLTEERARKVELEDQIAYLNTRIDNLSLAQDDSQASYEAQREELNESLISAKNEAESLAYHLQAEQNKKSALEQELASLQQSLNVSQEEYQMQEEALRGYINGLERRLESTESALYEKASLLEQEAKAKRDLEQSSLALAEEIEQVRQEKNILENELRQQAEEHQATIASLKDSSDELARAIEQELYQKSQLERELSQLRADLEEALMETERTRYQITELENQPPVRDTAREKELEWELENQAGEISRLQSRIQNLESLAQSLETEKATLEQEVTRSQEVLSRAENQDRELKSKIAELEETLNSFRLDEIETP
ncbi:MAG: hypothetical protein KDK62_00935 [Chlamydiia bacterium]|nr:hypothetical protein [Chlamydiia bacterium]